MNLTSQPRKNRPVLVTAFRVLAREVPPQNEDLSEETVTEIAAPGLVGPQVAPSPTTEGSPRVRMEAWRRFVVVSKIQVPRQMYSSWLGCTCPGPGGHSEAFRANNATVARRSPSSTGARSRHDLRFPTVAVVSHARLAPDGGGEGRLARPRRGHEPKADPPFRILRSRAPPACSSEATHRSAGFRQPRAATASLLDFLCLLMEDTESWS